MEPSTSEKRLNNEGESEESNQKKIKTEDEKHERNPESEEMIDDSQMLNDMKKRKDEECQFLRLFTLILNIIISIKDVKDSAITESIQEIIDSFKQSFPNERFRFDQINLTKWEKVCGYLYRYASHGAGFARNRILNAIRNCTDLKRTLEKPVIKIISLGSGPGNDALGLCSALADLKYPEKLEITMVDKIIEWSLCIQLAKLLISNGNFGKTSDLFQKTNVILKYCQVDLPGNSWKDQNYFKILAEADVILIFKLISVLPIPTIYALQQSLYENMKDEALILLNHRIHKIQWTAFDCLYSWEIKDKDVYKSYASAEPRFNHEDNVDSILPINVLRKKKL